MSPYVCSTHAQKHLRCHCVKLSVISWDLRLTPVCGAPACVPTRGPPKPPGSCTWWFSGCDEKEKNSSLCGCKQLPREASVTGVPGLLGKAGAPGSLSKAQRPGPQWQRSVCKPMCPCVSRCASPGVPVKTGISPGLPVAAWGEAFWESSSRVCP